MQVFAVTSVLLTLFHRMTSETWNYADFGPDIWSDKYPLCAGQSQSPINIRTACTMYQSLAPFQFSSAYNMTHNFTLTNNGHTIVGKYINNGSFPLILSGGGLDGSYVFLNFHLHWGRNYRSGSEHQVNSVKYAGEIHFVHIHPETGRIAVLGVFMQSSRVAQTKESLYNKNRKDFAITENATAVEWTKYFTAAENLEQINNSIVLTLNLALLMGNNMNDFWRYRGSLTTPPCTEGVIWTMFKTPIIFTEDELNSFRTNILFEDYRGPQPLYDRMVYRNFPEKILSSISDYNYCLRGSNYNSANRFFNEKFFLLVLLLFSIIIIEGNEIL